MKKITVAKGDGIGPEIMEATLSIIEASCAQVEFEEIEIGEKVYLSGNSSGISDASWDAIRKNKILLKAPITTPQGGGYKSLNVTMRKALGLYANVRPCKSFYPVVQTKHPKMDVVIIRENEEDLYGGIEHQQTNDVVQCLKLISKQGSEKIIRYAFEYATHFNRKKVTCFTKDNIMKQTDGLFHKIFDEVRKEYPNLESEHKIVDIGTAKIADEPETFDVVVMPNLYGDIVSDITAQISGSVGLVGSSNIGSKCSMFEAIHGSAPDIAGQNVANPSGLIQGAVLMLNHIGETIAAEEIHNAWLKTIEAGIHTPDIYDPTSSKKKVGTKEFGEAVIAHLGQKPDTFEALSLNANQSFQLPEIKAPVKQKKELIGVDVFVDADILPDELGEKLQKLNTGKVALQMITNRGVKVWPNGFDETFCTNHWRCRYIVEDHNSPIDKHVILEILSKAINEKVDVIKTENLYLFDGKNGFSLGQGQ